MDYRADYLWVRQPVYERIARGEISGWSTPEEIAADMEQVSLALGIPDVPQSGCLLELGCGDGGAGAELEPYKAFIERLLEARTAARQAKDFAKSDQIRDLLAEAGLVVEDTAQGPRWEIKG